MDAITWSTILHQLPASHILQTWEWGEFKAQYGWQPVHQIWRTSQNELFGAALLLKRTLFRRLGSQPAVLYAPKGPLLDWGDASLREQVLISLSQIARKQGAIFIKIDPDVRLGSGVPGELSDVPDPLGEQVVNQLQSSGWRFSQDQIQFKNTMLINLKRTEEELLGSMKQKTRYNIRLADKRGVEIRTGTIQDLPELYSMYAETSLRDGFVIRSADYYLHLWSSFMQANLAQPLIADVGGRSVAGLILFYFGRHAWYLYGMSRELEREKMPNYLLQWEALRRAQALGCEIYDLWGAPDVFSEYDPMWGVYRFKDGLGGQVIRHIGAWDLPVRPNLYMLYTRVLPWVLERKRQRGNQHTRLAAGI